MPPAQHPGLVFSGPVAAGQKPQILQETVSVTLLYLPGGQGLGAKVCDVMCRRTLTGGQCGHHSGKAIIHELDTLNNIYFNILHD